MYVRKPNMYLHRKNKFATEEYRRKWVISEQKNRGVAKMVARNISSAHIVKIVHIPHLYRGTRDISGYHSSHAPILLFWNCAYSSFTIEALQAFLATILATPLFFCSKITHFFLYSLQ